jgi:hypothetical protein
MAISSLFTIPKAFTPINTTIKAISQDKRAKNESSIKNIVKQFFLSKTKTFCLAEKKM